VSELIHTSSKHQALEYARVSVHFHEITDDPVRRGRACAPAPLRR
jgi:hypothetical protein